MRTLALAVLALLPLAAVAQPKPDKADKADKNNPFDKVPGYTRHTVEGFTVMLSDTVTKADTTGFKRKPLEALEFELKVIAKLMTPKQVEALRKVPIWAEWEEEVKMTNGRDGGAVAMYYGGHQLSMLQKGKHPLMSKSVVIHQMRGVTAAHQTDDEGYCILLHELAHAVHDQVLGWDNASLKAAYAQAMERKLYDKSQYESTNAAEFFAVLTGAYFNHRTQFPKTRDDLRKHDPVTFKLMDAVWGDGKKDAATDPKARHPLADTGKGKFDLGVKLDDIKFGEPLPGHTFQPEDLKGRVAVVASFSLDDTGLLNHMAELHADLAPLGGLVVVGNHPGLPADRLKADLAGRDPTLTGVGPVTVRDQEGPNFVYRGSHSLVFDADGVCVFRGSGHDAAPHARAAFGRQVVAKTLPGDPPKAFKPIADALVSGQPPIDTLPKLVGLAQSSDATVVKQAKEVVAALTAHGQKKLDDAKALSKSDPFQAYAMLEPFAGKFKGTNFSEKVAGTVDGLKRTPEVAAELKARTAFEPIRKLDAALMTLPGSFDPTLADFQKQNGRAILELRAAVEAMKKKHPKAKATEQAEALAKKYK